MFLSILISFYNHGKMMRLDSSFFIVSYSILYAFYLPPSSFPVLIYTIKGYSDFRIILADHFFWFIFYFLDHFRSFFAFCKLSFILFYRNFFCGRFLFSCFWLFYFFCISRY